MQDIDLNKVTVKELDFTASYQLKCSREDSVEGLVFWFDTYFTPCHKQVVLSTSFYLFY